MMTYEYDPSKLTENGKDLMRFQLGDTMVEGKQETCALCDEEYNACLAMYPKSWKRAKLACLETIFRRFSYEVNTTDGPVTLQYGERAKLWKEEYAKLKAELDAANVSPEAIAKNGCDTHRDPYFRLGMMSRDHVGEVPKGGR